MSLAMVFEPKYRQGMSDSEQKEAGEKAWETMKGIIPGYMWPTKDMRTHLPDKEAFDAAMSWTEGKLLQPLEDGWDDDRGLYQFGGSGTGKTRTAFEICRRKLLSGSSVAYWQASGLKDLLFQVRFDADEKAALLDDLCDCSTLVIDELGHTLTDTFAETLRTILERRGPFGLVIVSQYSPLEFERQWSGRRSGELAKHGEAIARRLREFCVGVRFERPTKTKTKTTKAGGNAAEVPAK